MATQTPNTLAAPAKVASEIEAARRIPAGSVKVTAKDSATVAYLYANSKGRPSAIVYHGKSAKPVAFHWYTTEQQRARHLTTLFANLAASAAAKAERAQKRRDFQHSYKVGDVFRASWGYDQTNIDYYECVAVVGKMLELRELRQGSVETDWLVGKCTPLPGDYEGEPFRRLAGEHGIKIDEVRRAFLVEPVMVGGFPTYGADSWTAYH